MLECKVLALQERARKNTSPRTDTGQRRKCLYETFKRYTTPRNVSQAMLFLRQRVICRMSSANYSWTCTSLQITRVCLQRWLFAVQSLYACLLSGVTYTFVVTQCDLHRHCTICAVYRSLPMFSTFLSKQTDS